jgi:hypothetical protein
MDSSNELLTGKIHVSYNIATNTYPYQNIRVGTLSIMPQECKTLLGLNDTTPILSSGTIPVM